MTFQATSSVNGPVNVPFGATEHPTVNDPSIQSAPATSRVVGALKNAASGVQSYMSTVPRPAAPTEDIGDAPVTQADLQDHHDALSGQISELSGQVSGIEGSGAANQNQNINSQQFSPQRMAQPSQTVASPLEKSAQQAATAHASMAAGRQNLANTQASFSQNAAARQSQGSRYIPSGSGNAASSNYNDVSMSGQLGRGSNPSLTPPSGLGSSAATWSQMRFRQ